MPEASAATRPGKVAEPAACEKKASRRSTIHAPSTPPVTAEQHQLEQRLAQEGQIRQVEGRRHRASLTRMILS